MHLIDKFVIILVFYEYGLVEVVVGIRFLKVFGYIALYFFLMSVVGMVLFNNNASDPVIALYFICCFVLFFPMFIFAGKRAFSWPAEHDNPITQDKLKQCLSRFKVDGLSFSFDEHKDCYWLTPSGYTMSHGTTKKQVQFCIKIWLDEQKKTVFFCDHLMTKKTGFMSFDRSVQKGMITLKTVMYSSEGKQKVFSTSAVHDKLINMVTRNGWKLQGKVL